MKNHKTIVIDRSPVYGEQDDAPKLVKTINIALFGKGNVGGALIEQIVAEQNRILEKRATRLNIFAIAGRKQLWLNENGLTHNWVSMLGEAPDSDDAISQITGFSARHRLQNLIAIDNTASTEICQHYPSLVQCGFDLISSNKIANTQPYNQYRALRKMLKDKDKHYLYETNVAAGLPLIDTIKLLHSSGENITRIRGVFSGSLSYVFNQFSIRDVPFSHILREAMEKGYTEPDPREDLCGNDVARKLLILARELELENELEEVDVHNLIPKTLRALEPKEFIGQLAELDEHFAQIKASQKPGHVLRYTGELFGNLQREKGQMKVALVSVALTDPLGQVKGADSIIEIFTDSYGEHPIVIMGAGAGAKVTARGVFGDLLRIAQLK